MINIPYWRDLPHIELYLDQVLLLVNDIIVVNHDTDDKGLTGSMVNNYVKHGYIGKPTKKKYQRKQVARLIAIMVLKNVFSIQEINQALNHLQTDFSSEEMYDYFASYMNGDTTNVPPLIASACETLQLYYQTIALTKIEEEKTHD